MKKSSNIDWTIKVIARILILVSCTCQVRAGGPASSLLVHLTRCEGKIAPIGVSLAGIHFSWILTSAGKNEVQTAYQIVVAGSSQGLNDGIVDLWNSGRVPGSESIQAVYAGKKMEPGTTYYWRVRIWDKKGRRSGWSAVSTFTTGLFTAGDWKGAKWIGYEELPDSMRLAPGLHFPDARRLGDRYRQRSVIPYFRKDFSVQREIKRATVFVTGLGQYEMNINGRKVGNSFLSPGWTDYDKRCLYNVYDVKGLLQKGQNSIGLVVGNGFYNISRERYYKLTIAYGYPKMICLLKIDYEDGTGEEWVSDGTWKTCPSPIVFSSIYGGEDYDATREQSNWASPGFDDAGWKSARVVRAPAGQLLPEADLPVTVQDSLQVKNIYKVNDSASCYDFGQNISGIIELRVKGHRGDTVRLTPSELLNEDRRPDQRASGTPYFFTYVLSGEGVETWRPRFSYYGFRYILAEQVSGTGSVIALTALHTRNSAEPTGSFHCSNALFNRINELIRWAIRSNMQSLVTDCPHREKLGWLEQDYLMGTSIQYNYQIDLLYKSIIRDMMDAQLENGLIPDIAPEYVQFGGGFRDSPEWGSASVILPWLLYKWYGDKESLGNAYAMMKRYVAYLGARSKDHLLDFGLGDWYDYGPKFPGEAQLTPKALTATAIYYYDVTLMVQVATLLHRSTDAGSYTQLAAEIKKAFNNAFFHKKEKLYATGSQTAMAMPLCVGLVDRPERPGVIRQMIDSIRLSGYKLTAGDVGFHFLIRALSDQRADEIIDSMNNRSDVAGYGYQLAKGATSLTESWMGLREASNNHLMLGHIMEWFYDRLGGIRQAEGSTAYKQIIIDPARVDELTSAAVSFDCPYGTIRSEWKKDGHRYRLHVEIPVNTQATIFLPTHAGGKSSVHVGSGIYDFAVDRSGANRPARR